MNCPKCNADISESYEPDDWSVGISAGWFCETCDLAVGDDGCREPMENDVEIGSTSCRPAGTIGTPLSELSGQPGKPGYAEFVRIAKSWGYE